MRIVTLAAAASDAGDAVQDGANTAAANAEAATADEAPTGKKWTARSIESPRAAWEPFRAAPP